MLDKKAFLGEVRLAPRDPGNSPGRAWWTHHIENTRALAQAVFSGNTPATIEAVRQLWDAVKSWELLTGSPVAGVLMGEHTVLAKMLVECLAKPDSSGCTGPVTDALGKNVELTRKLFPKDPGTFADLFGRHTELAGAYITDMAHRDDAAFQGHWAAALGNGAQLAAFTDRTFIATEQA